METDNDILEKYYTIKKDNKNYLGYYNDDETYVLCMAQTMGMVKYDLLNRHIIGKYFGATEALNITLQKDNYQNSTFVELLDDVYKLIQETLDSPNCDYSCKFPISEKNTNSVLKVCKYLNKKGFKTTFNKRFLTIMWL
jgi:hypothetical protein